MNRIKINIHGNTHCTPQSHGDWVDLATEDSQDIKEGEYRLISLGVSMELPDGYYAEVVPRSSTCKKWGVIQANSMGIIDHNYKGDDDIWCFPAYAIKDTYIPAGTRICQFRLVKQDEKIEFDFVDKLEGKNRGGFGSTGD